MNNLSAAKIKEQIEKQKQDLATWEKALKDQEEINALKQYVTTLEENLRKEKLL